MRPGPALSNPHTILITEDKDLEANIASNDPGEDGMAARGQQDVEEIEGSLVDLVRITVDRCGALWIVAAKAGMSTASARLLLQK